MQRFSFFLIFGLMMSTAFTQSAGQQGSETRFSWDQEQFRFLPVSESRWTLDGNGKQIENEHFRWVADSSTWMRTNHTKKEYHANGELEYQYHYSRFIQTGNEYYSQEFWTYDSTSNELKEYIFQSWDEENKQYENSFRTTQAIYKGCIVERIQYNRMEANEWIPQFRRVYTRDADCRILEEHRTFWDHNINGWAPNQKMTYRYLANDRDVNITAYIYNRPTFTWNYNHTITEKYNDQNLLIERKLFNADDSENFWYYGYTTEGQLAYETQLYKPPFLNEPFPVFEKMYSYHPNQLLATEIYRYQYNEALHFLEYETEKNFQYDEADRLILEEHCIKNRLTNSEDCYEIIHELSLNCTGELREKQTHRKDHLDSTPLERYVYGIPDEGDCPEEGLEFQVHPNPGKQIFVVQSPELLSGNAHIELLDINGKRVYSKAVNFSSPHYLLNIPPLRPGVYILRTLTENSQHSKKLIIEPND